MQFTIITAARRLEGVKRVIDCIDKQTYDKWEHIIVNDNSDEIRNNLHALKINSKFPKKRLWIDLGVRTGYYGGFARNVGTMVSFSYHKDKFANQGWVVFLDDDNLWYPNHLETLYKAHQENPEAKLIGVDMEIRGYINKDYKHILKCQIKPQQCDIGEFAYHKSLFEKYGYLLPSPRHKISYDYELLKKILEGEGEDKIKIVHPEKPTFVFYHKQR